MTALLLVSTFILYGCGGFALEMGEFLREGGADRVSDVIDASGGRHGELCAILGYAPALHRRPASVASRADKQLLICLGDAALRAQRHAELAADGFAFGTFVHRTAWLASSAVIGAGSIIAPFAYVGPHTRIGDNCLVNVHASVTHDVTLGAHCVICPQADLNGGSSCGEAAFIGAGAIVDPGCHVGAGARIGSGAVVKRGIAAGALAYGNPAREHAAA